MRLAVQSRAVWGVTFLTVPRPLLRTLRTPADAPAVVTARVLGARHVLQAVATAIRPSPAMWRLGIGVDAAHALTAAVLAIHDRQRRVPAVVETGLSAAWIITSIVALRGRR